MARDGTGQDEPEGQTRKRRFRLRPKMPRIHRGEMRASEEFQKLRDGMASTRHACPDDGAGMELLDVYPTGPDGEVQAETKPFRALVCPECKYTVPVSVLREQLSKEAEPLKQAERQFVLFGMGILILFGAITVMTGNLLTLLGALLFSLTLFLKALFYRYRHWQALDGTRLFQERPMVSTWLRDEFSKSV